MNEIIRCKNCKYWAHIAYGYGSCYKIKEKIEPKVSSGWDGHCVGEIETEEDFGCTLGELKDA